jgi:glycosyltransferase involved in cell wall biosynthesis
MSTRKYPNIGVVTFPLIESGIEPLSNLLEILRSLSDDLYLITGNAGGTLVKRYSGVNFHLVNHKTGMNLFSRIVKFIYAQLRISFKLAKLSRNVDLWLFFLGETVLILPMLAAKAARRQVVLCLAASDIQMSRVPQRDPLRVPVALISKINLSLCNRIVVYSERLITEWGLQKYRNKIAVARQHLLDFDKFKIERPLNKRGDTVGYIGRLSQEKGVMNFIAAMPGMHESGQEIKFMIGGDGPLRPQIEKRLSESLPNCKVELVGWIPHDELPQYLNQLKLLVVPSYTEALPIILLEAMACGTPVLATPVGAIPDVIRDAETGFLMTDNLPKNIARNVIRALDHPDLDRITQNARAFVETEFTYDAAVEEYRGSLRGFL